MLCFEYEVSPLRFMCRRVGPQLVALLRDDWIMRVLTPSTGQSTEEVILNGLVGGGVWSQEVGHWGTLETTETLTL